MADPETPPTQPLITSPSQQTAINVGAPAQGRSSSWAYKVAGITLLASVLIVGQAMIAYFLLSQRTELKSLEEQSNNLKTELMNKGSVSVPVKMGAHMNSMNILPGDFANAETSTGSPGPQQATNCQLEAAGLIPVRLADFRPACDERGLYKALQCFMDLCWCVSPVTGLQVPCTSSRFTGGMNKLATLPEGEA
ncbi:CD74 molecule, major histocompatibility complex, class II invariant chain b [Aulostomus maculatus]